MTPQILLEIPGDLGVTSVDVEKAPALARLAEGRSELVGLALWLMAERAKVGGQAAGSLVRRLDTTGPSSLLAEHARWEGHGGLQRL